MTKEQQVEKLKEGIAKHYWKDRYEPSLPNRSWEETGIFIKDECYRYADSLLSTVLAPLLIDTGEPENPYGKANNLGMWSLFDAGAKAARAKFVSIGEIVK